MVDVFISYSRANQAAVARLAEAVAAEGYSVWWDAELPAHRPYGDVITEQIGDAKAAIVVWSQSAAASEWVRAEADVARGQKKLIQTSIDGVMPPMPFNQIQFAAIGDWRGEPDHPGWRKVKASLDALCGPRDADDRPPMPIPAAPPPRALAASSPAAGGSGGRSWLLPALIVLALLVAGLGYLLLVRDAPDKKEAAPPVADKAAHRFILAAMIDDPDGFTNVRAEPNIDSPIVDRVEEGEAFTTYRQTGDWWEVRTADDNVGWMSSSRIRLLSRPGEPAPVEEPDDPPDTAVAPTPDVAPAAEAYPIPSVAREIFPDSDTRRLAPAELAGLSRTELSLARNE